MTEAKHTPGPWEVFTVVDEPQIGNFHSAIYGPAGDYDGLFVALANQNGNYEADARLIAAAPELLEALAQCQKALAMMITPAQIDQTSTLQAFAIATEAEAKARGAISKAEGRQ